MGPPLRHIKKLFRSFVGAGPRPARPGFTPGALVRQTQAQTWNRAKNKFCKLRAQWPGGKLGTHSNFARRKRCTPSQECVPRNGVRGKRPMDLGGAKRSRSPSDASPGAFCLLCRHGQSRSPPAGGEIPLRETTGAARRVVAPYRGRKPSHAGGHMGPPLQKENQSQIAVAK